MCALAARLDRQGFDVEILSYRSNGRSLAQMTDEIQSSLPERIINRFDIVAHSLGGLVGHQLAARLGASTISKVAMLGSPFLGTRAAEVIVRSRIARFIYGPIWNDLLPEERRKHDFSIDGIDMGMIAGVLPGTRFLPRGASDGLIPLASTKGTCFQHHIAIPASHASLLISKVAADNIGFFLKCGRFLQQSEGSHSDDFTPEQFPAVSQPQSSL